MFGPQVLTSRMVTAELACNLPHVPYCPWGNLYWRERIGVASEMYGPPRDSKGKSGDLYLWGELGE